MVSTRPRQRFSVQELVLPLQHGQRRLRVRLHVEHEVKVLALEGEKVLVRHAEPRQEVDELPVEVPVVVRAAEPADGKLGERVRPELDHRRPDEQRLWLEGRVDGHDSLAALEAELVHGRLVHCGRTGQKKGVSFFEHVKSCS